MQAQPVPSDRVTPVATAPVVAVVATTPETVLDDIARAMHLAGAAEALPTGVRTQLKVNISWQHWYPGCSSTPWQIEGVANALRAMGHADLIAAHNGTVVVDSYEGEENNRHKAAQDKVGLPARFTWTARPTAGLTTSRAPKCWPWTTSSPRGSRYPRLSRAPTSFTCRQ